MARAVTNNDQRSETEPPTAFDDLRHTIDMYDLFVEFEPFRVDSIRHSNLHSSSPEFLSCRLKLKPGFTRGFRQCANTPVVEEPVAVEYDLFDPCLDCLFRDQRADFPGCVTIATT